MSRLIEYFSRVPELDANSLPKYEDSLIERVFNERREKQKTIRLQHLKFERQRISKATFDAIVEALAKNLNVICVTADFHNCHLDGFLEEELHDLIESLEKCNHLREFIISTPSYCIFSCLDYISKLVRNSTSLKRLGFNKLNLIPDSSESKRFADSIRENQTITDLEIYCGYLWYSRGESSEFLEQISGAIRNQKSISKLRLCLDVTSEGMRIFADALKTNTSITCLDLSASSSSRSVDIAGILGEALLWNRTIQNLDLLCDERSLVLHDGLHKLFQGMRSTGSISSLNLFQTGASYLDIANFIEENEFLKFLSIQGVGDSNACSKHSLKVLAESLMHNHSLQSMKLSIVPWIPQTISALRYHIINNPSLISLDLEANYSSKIGLHEATQLFGSLIDNHHLRKLNLKGNLIGDVGVGILSCALMRNKTLEWISLENNFIKDSGLESFSECLKEASCALTWIDLRCNDFTGKGLNSLCCALQINSNLLYLNLSRCFRSSICSDELGRLILSSSSVETLFLQDNWIMQREALIVAKSLKQNTTLTNLSLGTFNSIGELGKNELIKAWKGNNTLLEIQCQDRTGMGLFDWNEPMVANRLKFIADRRLALIRFFVRNSNPLYREKSLLYIILEFEICVFPF